MWGEGTRRWMSDSLPLPLPKQFGFVQTQERFSNLCLAFQIRYWKPASINCFKSSHAFCMVLTAKFILLAGLQLYNSNLLILVNIVWSFFFFYMLKKYRCSLPGHPPVTWPHSCRTRGKPPSTYCHWGARQWKRVINPQSHQCNTWESGWINKDRTAGFI